MQPTYEFRSGHEGFKERAGITKGVVAEGAFGAKLIGTENKSEDDFVPNGSGIQLRRHAVPSKHWSSTAGQCETQRKSVYGRV